jgi:hypothetical protein
MTIVDHAKQRASERYNVHVNREKYYGLIHLIQTGKSTPIKRVSNSRSVHIVDNFIVVYSSTRKKIITFLPSDCKEYQDYSRGLPMENDV